MKGLRLQIGLRLLLLLVALFAVFFAWIWSQKELRRLAIQGELDSWEHALRQNVTAPIPPGMEAARKEYIEQIENEITRRRELMGLKAAK